MTETIQHRPNVLATGCLLLLAAAAYFPLGFIVGYLLGRM